MSVHTACRSHLSFFSTVFSLTVLAACGPDKPDSDTQDTIGSGDTDSRSETGTTDADNDGYPASEDCDDTSAAINPGATEVCNELDDNCDSVIDTDATDATTYYLDADADGYGIADSGSTVSACSTPEGYASLTDDCDDTNAAYHPGAEESDCSDPNDYNCDGSAGSVDADSDGFFACEECDDDNTAVNPLAAEVCNEIDDNCDSVIDTDAVDAPTWYTDADSDTYGDSATAVISCEAPAGTIAADGDCDDTSTRYNPDAAESDCADPNDYNCDGSVGYADGDGDGFAACSECDDSNGDINSSATEACDGVDNDCDGDTDEAGATGEGTWYLDADADGFGDASASVVSCSAPDGYLADYTDCDDALDTFHPGADEDCTDPADYNCDGSIGYADGDGDASPACEDCDDDNAEAYPGGVEVCDGVDNDCDTTTDEASALDASAWHADSDGDTFGDAEITLNACVQPDGFVADDTDCDDARDSDFPGADELCDNHDNDCDGLVDTNALDGSVWYADSDDDGYGDADVYTDACEAPAGYVGDASDCNDAEGATFPGADEFCDDVDNDCDGTADDGLSGAWYLDADGDGYGDPDVGESTCGAPSGYVADATDCDDAEYTVHPDASDTCDGVDTDCNGVVDNNTAPTAPVVSIAPVSPTTDDALAAQRDTAAYDADGDTLTYSYQWTRDGVSSGTTASIAASATTSGQTWSVQVNASDGCAAGPAGTATVTIANTAPTLTSVVLSPDPAYEYDVLTCTAGATTDADGDAAGLSYEWVVNGAALGFDSDSLDSGSFDRSDSVYCTATPSDGTDDGATGTSNTVTIGNSAPGVASVSISPEDATAASTLICAYAGYEDADGDPDTSTISWTADGVVVGTGATLAGAFVGGDVATCTVTPYDGTDTGPDVSASVTIGNTAPRLGAVSLTPSTAYNDDTLTCSATATDADGGAVGLAYAWVNTSSGVSLGSGASLSLSSALAASRDTIACTATASDADGATDVGTASVTLANRAPVASASLTPASPTRASELTCAATSSDADEDAAALSFAWTVDGTPVAASSTSTAQSTLAGAFGAGQSVACTVTVTDGKGGTGSDTASVVIDNTAPIVLSVALSPGSVYTNDTLTASVVASDPDGDTLSTTYDWYVDGTLVLSGTGGSLSGIDYFDREETLTVTVTTYDGVDAATASSDPVTVLNSAPSPPSIALSPSDAEAGDDLVCDVTTGSTDADGDAVTYSFAWEVEGSAHGGATDESTRSTVDGVDVGPEETWTCAVTAFDGTDTSDAATASATTTCLDGSQAACPSTSCLDILDAGASSGDGTYWIDPLGTGAYEVLCDMTTDAGGWTAVMKAVGGNFAYDDAVWTSSSLYNATDLDPTASGNAKYQSFNEVPFDTIRSSSTTTWSSGIDYTFSSTQDSALALFSGAGIDVSRTRSSYFNGIVPADEQSWNCSTYDAYGFNMLSYLGTAFLGGGGLCDWNGGSRWGNRANAYHSGTGNHTGQGWGSYSTLCPPYQTDTRCTFAISQVMWAR